MRSLFCFPVFSTVVLMMPLGQSSSAEAQITVASPAFQAGGAIPNQFTCKGVNQNPPLQFGGIPAGAGSLALILEDPDAPGGSFTHWLVWNIDPATTQIGTKSLPPGVSQGRNDFGKFGYGGPCPPSGIHRYFFRIYVLDRKLDLKSGAARRDLDKALAGHTIARGELMGRFGR